MTTTLTSPKNVTPEVYFQNVTDILSQAINGELVGMSNFARLAGTIDDVHEKMECIEHANCERQHAEGYWALAKKYQLPVVINQDGYYWRMVRECFNKYADQGDFIACIFIQEVILECFAVSMYRDAGEALADTDIGQLFLEISAEEQEHIDHSIDLLRAELDKDPEHFVNKMEQIHYDCMTILAKWSATKDLGGHCGICGGTSCMKESLYATGLEIKALRGNTMNLYMRTLDRIGIPHMRSMEWVANLPI